MTKRISWIGVAIASDARKLPAAIQPGNHRLNTISGKLRLLLIRENDIFQNYRWTA